MCSKSSFSCVFVGVLLLAVLTGPFLALVVLYIPRHFPYDTTLAECGFEEHFYENLTISSPVDFNSTNTIGLHSWYFRSPSKNPKVDMSGESFQKLASKFAIPFNETNADAFIIVVHGHGSNMARQIGEDKSLLEKVIGPLWTAGYNVLAFDLRNHGQSPYTGAVSFGIYESIDVQSAIAYVQTRKEFVELYGDREQTKPRLGLWGESMGAATSIITASKEHNVLKAVVADSSFSAMEDVMRTWTIDKVSWIPHSIIDYLFWCFSLFAPYSMTDLRIDEYASQVPIPVMIIHGKGDTLIPFSNAEKLRAAFAKRDLDTHSKQTIPLHWFEHDYGHVFSWNHQGYFEVLIDFFEEYV